MKRQRCAYRTSRLAILLGLLFAAGCESTTGPGDARGPKGLLYVPNQADGTMYVYDTETLDRVASFEVPVAEPHFVAFSANFGHYYVVGRQVGGELAKYRADNDSLLVTVTVPGQVFPTAVALHPGNDTLYLTDFTLAAGRTHRYLASGDQLVWRDSILQAGHQTHDIAISRDGRYVISAGFSSDDITILDTQQGNVEPLTLDSARPAFNPVSNVYGPYGVLIDETGRRAILACSKGNDQLRVVDLVNRTILDSILIPVANAGNPDRSGPTYMVIHPVNNNIVFVTNYLDHTMSVVRLSTADVIAKVEFETPRPFGIAISDDGTRVYVSCTNTRPQPGRVYVIDGETFAKLDSIEVGSEPFGLAWRPPLP